jgi:hypothetical protein
VLWWYGCPILYDSGEVLPEFGPLRLVRCLILTAALCVHTFGQSPAAASAGEKNNAVVVRAVAVQQEEDGSALEITSNGTLVPTITKLDGPLRLVIDLPGAINTVRRQLGAVAKDIRGVRVNQFQQNPPITSWCTSVLWPRLNRKLRPRRAHPLRPSPKA